MLHIHKKGRIMQNSYSPLSLAIINCLMLHEHLLNFSLFMKDTSNSSNNQSSGDSSSNNNLKAF